VLIQCDEIQHNQEQKKKQTKKKKHPKAERDFCFPFTAFRFSFFYRVGLLITVRIGGG
jgi:hypothetical protein